MAVTDFDGLDDYLEVPTANILTAFTGFILVKYMSEPGSGWQATMVDHTGSNSPMRAIEREVASDQIWMGSSQNSTQTNQVGRWEAWFFRKQAGSAASNTRHTQGLTDGTFVHNSDGTALADWTNHAGGKLTFGRWTTSEYADYRIALAAQWNTYLTDGEVEAIIAARSVDSILATQAGSLQRAYVFDANPITDLLGTAAETTRVGATVVAGDDPPNWNLVETTYTPTGHKVGEGTVGEGTVAHGPSAISKTLTPVTEADTLVALSFTKPIRKSLTAVSEADSAVALVVTKAIRKSLTPVAEADSALPLSVTKAIKKTLAPVSEADAALSLVVTKPINKALTVATETDTAVALDVDKRVRLHRYTDLPTGAVGYWKLGAAGAQDHLGISGDGAHIGGGDRASLVPSEPDDLARDYDGVDDRTTLPNGDLMGINANKQWAFECSVVLEGSTQNVWAIGLGQTAVGASTLVGLANSATGGSFVGQLRAIYRADGGATPQGTITTPSSKDYRDGQPHHVLVTMNAARQMIMWVDGVKIATTGSLSAGAITITRTTIGGLTRDVFAVPWNGGVDDVIFYDRFVTDAEALDRYARWLSATVTETDEAQALDYEVLAGGTPITVDLTPIVEADEALALTVTKPIVKSLTPVTETSSAAVLSVTKPIHVSLIPAVEDDDALPLSYEVDAPTFVTLQAVGETDEALPLTFTKTIHKGLTPVTETDTAAAIIVTKPIITGILPVSETDTARPLTATKTIRWTIVPVNEDDQVLELVYDTVGPRFYSITPVTELNTAWELSYDIPAAIKPFRHHGITRNRTIDGPVIVVTEDQAQGPVQMVNGLPMDARGYLIVRYATGPGETLASGWPIVRVQ
jgi:hypothetical protein